MKTKSSVRSAFAVLALAAVALLHADPAPTPVAGAEAEAKQKVFTQIHSKIATVHPSFSRAIATPSHRLDFQPQLLVQGEARLPFTITRVKAEKAKPEVQGYVRLSDQEIFVLDPATGKHWSSLEDPRFAPPKKEVPDKRP